MITDINDFFSKGCGRCPRFDTPECSALVWHETLFVLRQICLTAGLAETVKWGQPCYMHPDVQTGRNIILFGALKTEVRLTFFNAQLLQDPYGLLEPQGPNSQTRSIIRLTSADQTRTLAPKIGAYLSEAISYATKGIKPAKTTANRCIPDELTDALDADPHLAEAFEALTPGRKQGYYLHIGTAKQAKTRVARVEKMRPRIFAGKGFSER